MFCLFECVKVLEKSWNDYEGYSDSKSHGMTIRVGVIGKVME